MGPLKLGAETDMTVMTSQSGPWNWGGADNEVTEGCLEFGRPCVQAEVRPGHPAEEGHTYAPGPRVSFKLWRQIPDEAVAPVMCVVVFQWEAGLFYFLAKDYVLQARSCYLPLSLWPPIPLVLFIRFLTVFVGLSFGLQVCDASSNDNDVTELAKAGQDKGGKDADSPQKN